MRDTRDSDLQTSVSAGGFDTAELRFPVVVLGLGKPGFAADIFDGASGFDGLENGDDLVFGESGFTHVGHLSGHNHM